ARVADLNRSAEDEIGDVLPRSDDCPRPRICRRRDRCVREAMSPTRRRPERKSGGLDPGCLRRTLWNRVVPEEKIRSEKMKTSLPRFAPPVFPRKEAPIQSSQTTPRGTAPRRV